MKAYCINLDRRPDRLEHMTRQFDVLGLPFERVPAVDARDSAVAEAALRCSIGMTGRRMSAGAFGCFQSHREVWRRLVTSGESHVMVFEDDVILAEGITAYLDPAWVPADADLVRLETFLTRFHRDRGPGNIVAGRRIHRMRSRHAGAGSYVISAGAADRLLAVTQEIADPIDELIFNEKSAIFASLVTYQMIPAPAMQGNLKMLDRPDWSISSIPERFAKGEEGEEEPLESTSARLQRRLREELHSLVSGTRYVVAPFG